MMLLLEELPDGKLQAKVGFNDGDSTIKIGVQLASATRIIAQSMCDAMKLPKSHEEQIEAQIVEAYDRDMKVFGALGEATRKAEPAEVPELASKVNSLFAVLHTLKTLGVQMDSPDDFKNWVEDHASADDMFKSGFFPTPDADPK